jgi:serine protease inhibitor
MSGPDVIAIWSGAGYKAAALPYSGKAKSMVVIVFVIRDDATGAILFQGRVVEPTQ